MGKDIMIPLYTQEEYNNTKSNDKLPCQCYQCGKPILIYKKLIKQELKHKRGRVKFCSSLCKEKYNESAKELINCKNCNTKFYKTPSEIKRTTNHFCSRSCSATYNNKHKKFGIRRSKLEAWLEEQLAELYPDLDIRFNDCEAIGSELDIYIPSLNLAFEINGIFHYKPIFGRNKLERIQENDQNKYKACLDNEIDLCIIDASGLKYFKERNAQKYLDIITDIIDGRSSTS